MVRRKPLVQVDGQVKQLPDGDFVNLGKLNIGLADTIAANNTITVSNSHIVLYNFGSTQNVDTINGGNDGDIIVIRLATGSSNVRVRKGNGNIYGGSNRVLRKNTDILTLVGNGSAWAELSWQG